MKIKKSGGRVYGADLTVAEKSAMQMEIQRQLAEYDRKHAIEIDAMILWVLHAQLGWGEKRLKRFYDSFSDEIDALIERYQMDKDDGVWLCTYKLKERGIDLEQWEREKNMAASSNKE